MNVLLIGMPGCGKTAFGKAAAECLKLDFIDTDSEIENREGPIPDIFADRGEEGFRKTETEVLRDCLKGENRIISTGGGIVTRDENIKLMKDSGSVVIFIDRPIDNIKEDIDTSGRPLLKEDSGRLKRLYEERYEKYTEAATALVINDGTFASALGDVLRLTRNAFLKGENHENFNHKRS